MKIISNSALWTPWEFPWGQVGEMGEEGGWPFSSGFNWKDGLLIVLHTISWDSAAKKSLKTRYVIIIQVPSSLRI